jgi:sulfur carrier protein
MHLIVNGTEVAVSDAATVADLAGDARGRAVAVNGRVVPRDRHVTTRLVDGDEVEIVTAVQGG